jgi:MtN3 and saliva related transmembrane protein
MQLTTDHLGFIAAICTTSAFVPQVLLVWRARVATGISTGMYLTFIVGLALWCCYGIMVGAWPVIIANGVTLLLASAILIMKLHFERPGLRAE